MNKPSPGQLLFERADNFAARHHALHTRDRGEPYIDHPRAAADIIREVMGAQTTYEQAIAVLHDTIEMCDGVTEKTLKLAFGSRVARDVKSLSRDSGMSADQRRRWLWKTRRSKSARIAMAADKIHNMRTIPSDWPLERQQGYLLKMRETYDYLESTDTPVMMLGLMEGAYNDAAIKLELPRLESSMRDAGWRPGMRTRGKIDYTQRANTLA